MEDISRPIVAIRYISSTHTSQLYESDVGLMCEYVLDESSKVKKPYKCSEKTYNYFSDIDVSPHDFVIVRGGDAVKLAIVDHIVTDGNYRPFRTIIAKVDFGKQLEQKRKEAEQKILIDKIEKTVKAMRTKEDIMSSAKRYAKHNPELADMLAKLKEMEKQSNE